MPNQQGKLSLKLPAYEPPRIEAALDEIELLDRDAALLHQGIRDAVNEVEPKQCAWVMKRDGGTLSNWINERSDAHGIPRMPPAKLLLYLGQKQKSGRLAALLSRLWGMAPPVRSAELSPEEELRRIKDQLRAEGSFGAHVLEKALGR